MKRISIFFWIFIFCTIAIADQIIFRYRDRGIEITVKLIDPNNGEPAEPNEPGTGEPAEPNEPGTGEPAEPNGPGTGEPAEPNEPPAEPAAVWKWISPDGVSDPNGAWSADANIKDVNDATYAVARIKETPLLLYLSQPADSNACRLFMRSASRFWRVDILSNSSWQTVFEGGVVPGLFQINYPIQKVSAARISQTGGSANGSIREFEFYAAISAGAEPADPNEPDTGEPSNGEPAEPVEPNEPLIITSNIQFMENQGQLFKNIDKQRQRRILDNLVWWNIRYARGWEQGNSPPWYIRDILEETYGENFWEK